MRRFTMAIGLLLCASALTFGQDYVLKKVASDNMIVLDGIGDEVIWEMVEATTLDSDMNNGSEASVVSPEDEFDFSASFKAVWGDSGIYILLMVTDFEVDTTVEADEGWPQTDLPEIYLQFGDGSTFPEGATNIWNGCGWGVFQVPIDLRSTAMTGGASSNGCYDDFKTDGNVYAATSFDMNMEGYVVEEFISWKVLTDHNDEPVVPAADLTFIMDIGILDVDGMNTGSDDTNIRKHIYWKTTGHMWFWPWADFNAGTVQLSDETVTNSVRANMLKDGIGIYPNPVQTELFVKGNVDLARVYSIVGNEIMERHLSAGSSIDVSSLEKGIYLVNLYSGNELAGTRRFVKF